MFAVVKISGDLTGEYVVTNVTLCDNRTEVKSFIKSDYNNCLSENMGFVEEDKCYFSPDCRIAVIYLSNGTSVSWHVSSVESYKDLKKASKAEKAYFDYQVEYPR